MVDTRRTGPGDDAARLGTLVTGVTYRNPALLAKTATTLDVISGGRAILGLGAAWNDIEHAGYGFDFPPVRERMDRLDEALTIIRAMFTEERPSFEGRYYRIEDALNVPRPVQQGGPRILVGGGGEQRTLKIAAKHADMTHWFPLGFEVLRHKTEVLERHCAEIGRDPSTIERTMGAPVIVAANDAEGRPSRAVPRERRPYINVGPPEQIADALQPYLDAGFTGFTFNNAIYRTPEADRPSRRAAPARRRRDTGHRLNPHACVGLHLAQFETRSALLAVLDGWPGFEIEPDRRHPPASSSGSRVHCRCAGRRRHWSPRVSLRTCSRARRCPSVRPWRPGSRRRRCR